MDRFRRVWLHLSVRFGSRLRRRAMPGYSLLSVVNLCLHLVKVSVLIELCVCLCVCVCRSEAFSSFICSTRMLWCGIVQKSVCVCVYVCVCVAVRPFYLFIFRRGCCAAALCRIIFLFCKCVCVLRRVEFKDRISE